MSRLERGLERSSRDCGGPYALRIVARPGDERATQDALERVAHEGAVRRPPREQPCHDRRVAQGRDDLLERCMPVEWTVVRHGIASFGASQCAVTLEVIEAITPDAVLNGP
jgi:hypothetical protein